MIDLRGPLNERSQLLYQHWFLFQLLDSFFLFLRDIQTAVSDMKRPRQDLQEGQVPFERDSANAYFLFSTLERDKRWLLFRRLEWWLLLHKVLASLESLLFLPLTF